MQSKRSTLTGLGVALLAALALPVLAFRQPDDSPLRQKIFSVDELYISSALLSENDLISRGENSRLSQLSRLGANQGGAYLDPRSNRWGTLMQATPMVPGRGNQLAWRSVAAQAPNDLEAFRAATLDRYMAWLDSNAADLGLDLSELAPAKVTVHRDGALVQIHVPRVKNGLRVRGSFLHGVINNGNLVLWGAIKWGNLNDSGVATVNAERALLAARNHVGSASSDFIWGKKELLYVPVARGNDPREVSLGDGYGYRLVWALYGRSPSELGEWEALVDARSGDVIAFADKAHYAVDPGADLGVSSTREVQGGVYPITNDGADPDGIEHIYPMPFAFIDNNGETLTTDSGGNVPVCVDGTISTTLDGPYVTLTDNCGQLNESTSGAVLDLGVSGGIDCTVPPGGSVGNTHASRSGFYEINRDMEIGRSYLPDNNWLTLPLPVEMNIALNCNATGGPGGLRFYQSGGGCSNTGEIAGVFVHEWGHGMDGADATPGIANPGEGIADIYAALRLDTSCIGRNFLSNNCGGYGDPCINCSGVRDIDFAMRQSGQPHDIAFIDASCEFPNDGNAAPCNGSVHCEGAVYGEAVWDLWKRDLPNAGINAETASRLATRLTFEGAGAVGTWYTCVDGAATGDGCNADGGYLNYLAADDTDGNLNNGTPHMFAIDAAFGRHGISCPTPAVQNGGCGGTIPAVAPVVNANPIDRGVVLTWNAVPNAVAYRVFRGEGVFACDFGKEYLGETSDLTFIDDNLKNGFEYYYVVTPVGANGSVCMGPSSSCTTVTPVAGGNVTVAQSSSNLVIDTGDGDQFLDSCEAATLNFDVENIGTGALTNPRIVSVTSPSHPILDGGITGLGMVSASIAECSSATGSFSFTAAGIAFGETIEFLVELTSDELSPLTRTFTLTVTDLESDFQTFATKTFDFETDVEGWAVENGTFTRSDAVAGAGGSSYAMNSSTLLDNQCDRVRSPIFVPSANTELTVFTNYDIENFGPNWWDRANLATIDESGTRTVIEPSGGRDYDTTNDHPDFSGCNTGERGWAGTANGQTWGSSTWDATALGSGGLAGQQAQLQFTYGTDGAAVERGFAFDRVTLTNIDLQVEDAQMNCALPPNIFADGFESEDTEAWAFTQ